MKKNYRGFTLIELLIVIAILGTLAVVVLIALNPVQQLARTRDAGRLSGVTQLGHAVEAFGVTHDSKYPYENANNCDPAAANWVECLVEGGEINTVPAEINDGTSAGTCTKLVQNNTWCYDTASSYTSAIVYARLESDSNNSRCTNASRPDAYAVYSTADGRGGTVCRPAGTDPVANTSGQSFID